jgi:hypothetical protein
VREPTICGNDPQAARVATTDGLSRSCCAVSTHVGEVTAFVVDEHLEALVMAVHCSRERRLQVTGCLVQIAPSAGDDTEAISVATPGCVIGRSRAVNVRLAKIAAGV